MLSITTLAFLFLYKNLQTQQRLALLKSDFISNITHELKTPIATVGVAIEALRNFDAIHNPDRTREYLDISASELQRLSMLVDKVLRLSMFEQNKMELTKEPVDLKELVQEVMQSMKLQFEKRNAVVEFTPSNTDAMVLGDKLHLLSVVYNLLDNAMKYSAEKPWIQIAIYQQDSGLQLRVKDNGIGIAPEYRLKVFDKFFRVPHGNTHNVKGYGLGLSYVHEVIQKHGGTIVVQAAEPNGSEFIMNLPVYNLPS
jgi:signal transduction histidine kinase